MAMFTRLFDRRRRSDGGERFIEAQRRVLDYARYLEDHPPLPGRIRDTRALPHEKVLLKRALLMCISHASDGRLEEHLKAGYLMLSAFQPGVGSGDIGPDFAALDLDADPLDIATRIECDSDRARDLVTRAEAELAALRDELRTLELRIAEPDRLSA